MVLYAPFICLPISTVDVDQKKVILSSNDKWTHAKLVNIALCDLLPDSKNKVNWHGEMLSVGNEICMYAAIKL